MKLKHLYVATFLATLPATSIFAAALERSNQSISAFLEPGNYIETGFNVYDRHTKGSTTNTIVSATGGVNITNLTTGRYTDLGEVNNTHLTPNIALKIQPLDNISVGLIYDRPFWIETDYANATRYMENSATKTSLDINTQNLSLLVGYQPNKKFNIYSGLVYQKIEGKFKAHGTHMSGFNSNPSSIWSTYSANINDDAYGWLIGFEFKNDQEKFKSSITYRSKINHKFNANETGVLTILNVQQGKEALNEPSKISTPQSINLDLSQQLTDKLNVTLATRWINWKDFNFHLPYYQKRAELSAAFPPFQIKQLTIK